MHTIRYWVVVCSLNVATLASLLKSWQVKTSQNIAVIECNCVKSLKKKKDRKMLKAREKRESLAALKCFRGESEKVLIDKLPK